MSVPGKSRRGFAAMTPGRRRVVSGNGGKTAHALGRAHEFTTEEARKAGVKGGLAAQATGKAHQFTPAEARKAGRKGGRATARRRWGAYVRPSCLNCEAHAQARGLCRSCYRKRATEVRAGKTSWEALERAGLARPLLSARQAGSSTARQRG
jgi:hypothetical protein